MIRDNRLRLGKRNWAIYSLRTLVFLSGAAVAAAITFAVFFGENETEFEVDEDGSRIQHTVRGDSSEFSLKEDGLAIKAEWRGDFKLNDDGARISAIDDFLVIDLKEGGIGERVRFEKDGRKVIASYWREGEEQEPGAETQALVDDVTLRFLRASAFEADMRVTRLLKKGGVDSVLTEIDALKSDYAIRRYAAALSERETLSPDQVSILIEKLGGLRGDHDMARALQAVVEKQGVSGEAMLSLLSLADMIESDYEKRRVLTVVTKKPLSPEAADAAFALLETIEGAYDYRVAAEALLTGADLNADTAARLLAAASDTIDSDHDLRLVLTKAAPRLGEGPVADAWLHAYGEIGADYDRRVALETAASLVGDNEELKERLRAAAAEISSDYDRKRALEALK